MRGSAVNKIAKPRFFKGKDGGEGWVLKKSKGQPSLVPVLFVLIQHLRTASVWVKRFAPLNVSLL